MICLNQNIMEVQIYGDYIKVTVAENWGLSTNTSIDDVNHPCSVELRDVCGREKISF